jgi:hypothetical protein
MTLKQRIAERVDKWTWYRLAAFTITAIGLPLAMLTIGPNVIPILGNPATWSAIALFLIFESVLAVGVWVDWSRSRTNDPWLQRSVGVGLVAGGCVGNSWFPIFGLLPGLVVGAVIGLVAGGALCFARVIAQKRSIASNSLDLATRAVVFGGVATVLLATYQWFVPGANASTSGQTSHGDFIRTFLLRALWPSALFVMYLLMAATPTVEHPVAGRVSKRRLVLLYLLLVVAVVSSFVIGASRLLPTLPTPT